MTKYNTKRCDKHDLNYYDYLSRCPICVGEEMAVVEKPTTITIKTKRVKMIKRIKPKIKRVRI